MALQSAISATPMEKFCTEDDMSDGDRFSLRLSDGEEDDTDKNNENQKTDKAASSATAETEDEILNKYDTTEAVADGVVDEDILLNEKSENAVLKENELNERDPLQNDESRSQNNSNQMDHDNMEEKDIHNEHCVNETIEVDNSAKEISSDASKMDTEDIVETQVSDDSSRSRELDAINSVSKDLKDTMDTEDLLQVTSVKEADAANENSSSSSSEKDELEDATIDDSNDREDDDTEELIERPSEAVDCGDVLDIEENNPLGGVEVSEEMNKDYENLLNSERESDAEGLSEKAADENGKKAEMIVLDNSDDNVESETKVHEKSNEGNNVNKDTTSANSKKSCEDEKEEKSAEEVQNNDKDDQGHSIGKVFTQNAVLTGICDEPEDKNATKPIKRSLSDCETEIGSKKIRLSQSQNLSEKKIVVLQTLVDFMKTKSLKKLSRRHLEEFCIQKMCEVLIHKSEVGELRHQLQTQEQMMEFWKKETTAMAKQVKDLEIVNKKMLNELKIRQEKDTPPVPVKITRSVGLQVKLETVSAKRLSRSGSETSQTPSSPLKVSSTNVMKTILKSPSPQVNRQNKETTVTQSPTLLSQALTKEAVSNNNSSGNSSNNNNSSNSKTAKTEPKGVIDLTDEDERTPSTTSFTNNAAFGVPQSKAQSATVRTAAPIPSIAIVASKPSTTGVATSTAPRFMYVLQPNQQLPQTDLSKPGTAKTVMLKLPNGVIGPTNGILPALQNGSSTICSLPQTTLRTGPVKLQSPPSTNVIRTKTIIRHPAPLPPPPTPSVAVSRKPIPPKPQLSIRKSGQGIVLSWKLPFSLEHYEAIASYQLYAYQETSSPPNSDMWRKVGDVKALALPMACTLTQFADGNKYYFAVRAVDILKRIGPFSDPEPISL